MRLNEPDRRRRAVNLTPLIDVVFLLLVFFMLASTFLKFGTVELETAGGGAGSADLTRVLLVHVGPDDAFKVGGRPTAAGDLPARLAEALESGRSEAVLVLGRGATASDLVRAVAAVKRHAFTSVRVVD